MDITYPPEAEAFRERVRSFLGENLPAGWTGLGGLPEAERETFRESWRRTLADHQMLAVSWPQEYGGAGLSLVEQVVLAEEFARAGAPQGSENDTFGIGMLGNTLIHLGTEEQKKHYLPRILSGEQRWCQGYSEPDAGSDLAGIRTAAVLDGDEWVINGQKTWTSAGHLADHIFVLARTDPSAPKHKGITFLLVPMDQPGVEVRPIRNLAGYALFNEVFFTDARTASHEVVGAVDDGWRTAMALLGFERGVGATTDAIRFRGDLDRLVSLARERGLTDDPRIRERLAWCHSRVEVMRYRGLHLAVPSAQRRAARPGSLDHQGDLVGVRPGLHRAGDGDPRPGGARADRPGDRRPAPDARGRHGELPAVVGRDLHGCARRNDLRRQLAGPAQHHRRAAARPAQGAAPGRRPVPRALRVEELTWTSPSAETRRTSAPRCAAS